ILIREGIDPARVIRLATLNGAVRYGLHDIGAVAPGKLADLVLLDSLEEVKARSVLANGRVVVRDGKLAVDVPDPVPPPLASSGRIGPLSTDDFVLQRGGANGDVLMRVIDVDQNRTTRIGDATVQFRAGRIELPLADELSLLSVVPRHGQPHRP